MTGAAAAALLLAAAPAAAAPVVETLDAGSVTPHTARVGGTIDPAGTATDAIVQWGVAPAIGNTILGPTFTGTGAQLETQQLTGLSPSTSYSFRLVGQQGPTPTNGVTRTFTTPAEPVLATTAPAPGAIGWNTATVGGTIDPQDGDVHWAIEYGPSAPDYGSFDGYGTVPALTAAGPVSARLSGLDPGTTYHFRLVAFEQGAVTWAGADRSFTTRGEQPAADVARAMAVDPAQVVGASWLARPPSVVTGALLGGPLSGFPLDGGDFAAISSGTVDDVDAAGQDAIANADGGGGQLPDRGAGAYDVSVLQVGLQVPPGASCLSFAFRFLSEEFPQASNPFDDAFIAELDTTSWTSSASAITAPLNFALGPGGRVVSVNGLGAATTSEAGGAGTRFDHGTAILRASAPITPGPHTLYLSLFDQGDGIFDSAVLIDRLQFTATPAGACQGAVVDDSTPILTGTPASGSGSVPGASAGVAAETPAPSPAPVLGKQVVGAATQGTVLVTRPRGRPVRLTGSAPIPLGSTVDTRKGRVRITAAGDTGDGRLSGEFYGGVFVVTQDRRAPVTTVLRLTEDVGLDACPRVKRARSSGKRRRKPGKRFVWGDGKGRFRTTGSYGAATVRGTKWLVQDSCAGTLVKAERGVVEARDFAKRKTVTVGAGRSYLARRAR